MLYLQTRDGFVSHRAIVRIKPLCVDDGVTIYSVAYVHGTEPLNTTATGDDVDDYLAELQ
jgi:hypothetical protein